MTVNNVLAVPTCYIIYTHVSHSWVDDRMLKEKDLGAIVKIMFAFKVTLLSMLHNIAASNPLPIKLGKSWPVFTAKS